MDFNINNETFANAYKCLSEANVLLQNGLGNFNDLESSALSLINKKNISNSDRLYLANDDCLEIKAKMERTIGYLMAIDTESAYYFENILENNSCIDDKWDGVVLTATMGFNAEGPSGSETWYDLGMSRVVENMEKKYGFTNLEYNIRGDGVKVLSGTTPDGERFENLVIVAADVYHESANPKGTFERGQIVETSLGMGIVADYCGRSENDRKYKGTVHFDIATAWHTGKYMAAAYGKNPQPVSNEYFEQVVPGSYVKSNNIEYDEITSNDSTPSMSAKEVLLRDGTDIKGIFNKEDYVSPKIPYNKFDDSTPSMSAKEVLLRDGTDIKGTFNKEDYVGPKIPNIGDVVASNKSDNINHLVDINDLNIQPKNNSLIAHRGYHPGGIFENSIDAFKAAGEQGFRGCETDVRFDNNGNLVCSHNAVKKGENPPPFEEYLDVCKEYGMIAVIDLKYGKNNYEVDTELSKEILKVVEEKGMMDSCILQTDNPKDIPYIRELSDEARICFLTNEITDDNINLAVENNVECVNIHTSDRNLARIKILNDNQIDVCVWGVEKESSKDSLMKNGATYVMSDFSLGITPYQEGDFNYNPTYVKPDKEVPPVVSLSTDTSQLFDGDSNTNVKATEIADVGNVSLSAQMDNDDVVIRHSEVPLFYQSDYTNVNYGTGTVATHGCGIASLSMVASYYNDTDILPDELAIKYRGYGSSSGTDHTIFEKTADDLNLPFREHIHYRNGEDLQTVVSALQEGCVVVAKAKKNSIFTESGHYIVLTGVTEDGKIMVNDPNKYNYKEFSDNPGATLAEGKTLTDGFENGFEQEVFKYGKINDFFIYSPKSNS